MSPRRHRRSSRLEPSLYRLYVDHHEIDVLGQPVPKLDLAAGERLEEVERPLAISLGLGRPLRN
jgi:hypothetical protein